MQPQTPSKILRWISFNIIFLLFWRVSFSFFSNFSFIVISVRPALYWQLIRHTPWYIFSLATKSELPRRRSSSLSSNQREYVNMFSSNLIVATEIKLCLISCFLTVYKQKIHFLWKTPVDDTWTFFSEKRDLVDTRVLSSLSGWWSFSSLFL